MRFFIYTVTVIFAFLAGAVSHEGDIQVQCATKGTSGHSTWRGELICSPKGEN